LQLSIGGRGLDPNRTSNFNTRQNGYDISADVLGYPESYYATPTEALEEIQLFVEPPLCNTGHNLVV
jgi:Fe(3+) dicitrate transport protein